MQLGVVFNRLDHISIGWFDTVGISLEFIADEATLTLTKVTKIK
ncbi:MAG: hypothetical protein ACLRSL_03525 [Streptococcus sp.]